MLKDKGLEFFNAHNKIRTDPKSYIPTLKEMLTKFDASNPLLFQTKDSSVKVLTREGAGAI